MLRRDVRPRSPVTADMAPAGKLSARGTPLIARRARSPSPQPSAATRAEFKRSFAEAAGGGQPSSAGAASAAAPSAASKSAVISESKSTTQAQAEASETKKASISKDDDPFDENLIHEILAPTSTLGGLYLGNEMAARDEAALKSKSIGAVLNATIELKCSFPNTIKVSPFALATMFSQSSGFSRSTIALG